MKLEDGLYLAKAVTNRPITCVDGRVRIVGGHYTFTVEEFFRDDANVVIERIKYLHLNFKADYDIEAHGSMFMHGYDRVFELTEFEVKGGITEQKEFSLEYNLELTDHNAPSGLKSYSLKVVTGPEGQVLCNDYAPIE